MSEQEDQTGSLFSLFKGDIPGEVVNRFTGNIHTRKDVMDHYHFLIIRSVKDPANTKLRDLVRMVADLLEIPSDIHQALIIEAWKDNDLQEPGYVDAFIRADMEAMFDVRTGEVFVDIGYHPPVEENNTEVPPDDSNRVEIGLMDHHLGVYDQAEVEEYSLISKMERDDISLDEGTSIMDDTSKDSPFYSEGWEKKNVKKKSSGQSAFSDRSS